MKKILSIILITASLFSLAACKEKEPYETPAWMKEPEIKDYVDFRNEAEEVTVEQAKAYLESEDADETTGEYRQAVYTVNEAELAARIEQAHEEGKQTDQLKEAFGGIYFRLIEGDDLKSEAVKSRLIKKGTYAKSEDGLYLFTFYDRTLAQAAVSLDDPHSLNEYMVVLELLLEDPNVVVITLEDK